jgi:hypothetical protein
MKWIEDPGHCWLEVGYSDLADIGMGVSDFSRYSYVSASKQLVYLEEDSDAPKFISRHPQRSSDYFSKLPTEYLTSTQQSYNKVRRCQHIGG